MLQKGVLEQLYCRKGKSMQEIASQLKCSSNQVGYWMKKFGITVRARSEAMYQKYNPDGDPFLIKEPTTTQEWLLLGLGLGLWWGEGTKKNRHAVRLGNTDPQLLRKFIEFWRKFAELSVINFILLFKCLAIWIPRKQESFGFVRSVFLPSNSNPRLQLQALKV